MVRSPDGHGAPRRARARATAWRWRSPAVRRRCRIGERVVDARPYPTGGRAVRQSHDEHGWERPHRRVEQWVGRVHVAAHDLGAASATAVAQHRNHGPRQRVEEREDRNARRRSLAAHAVVIAVRHHDDVARVGPVAHAVVDGHPARPRRDDVEQGQPVRTGHQGVGEGERRRLELERLGQLGAEEQRAFEPEAVEGRPQSVAHWRISGVAAQAAGVPVMASPSARPDDRNRP